MYNKKVVILIGILIFLFSLLLLVNIFNKPKSSSQQQQQPIPIFTRTPEPSVVLITPDHPKPVYDLDALNQDYLRITNRKELSTEDKTARQSLINSLKEDSD